MFTLNKQIVGYIFLILFLTSCSSTLVEFKIEKPKNKIYLSKEFFSFIKSLKSKPNIVLRVPNSQYLATEKTFNNEFYDFVEREFIKQGFIIRDRGLLNALVTDKDNIDYQKIADKIKTDLILEISFKSKIEDYLPVRKVAIPKSNSFKTCDLDETFFAVSLYEFDIKITIVKEGLNAGSLKIYSAPCTDTLCSQILEASWDRVKDIDYKNGKIFGVKHRGNLFHEKRIDIGFYYSNEELAESLVQQLSQILFLED